jgi:hypothetical protein
MIGSEYGRNVYKDLVWLRNSGVARIQEYRRVAFDRVLIAMLMIYRLLPLTESVIPFDTCILLKFGFSYTIAQVLQVMQLQAAQKYTAA